MKVENDESENNEGKKDEGENNESENNESEKDEVENSEDEKDEAEKAKKERKLKALQKKNIFKNLIKGIYENDAKYQKENVKDEDAHDFITFLILNDHRLISENDVKYQKAIDIQKVNLWSFNMKLKNENIKKRYV